MGRKCDVNSVTKLFDGRSAEELQLAANVIEDMVQRAKALEQLEKHPSFHYESEGLLGSYFSPPPPYGSFAIGPPAPYERRFPYGHFYRRSRGGRYPGSYGAWGWEYYPERFRVSGILDREVWNEEGLPVGKIDDLIIDPHGQVQTLILSVGSSLALEKKLVAFPFHPLRVNGAGIVLEVTRQQLEKMPAFRWKQ